MKLPSTQTLRSENQIIANWKGDTTKPLVSIRCTAFNHVEFIEDAIKGFLIQETEFPIEILVHDDASTDGTREIVEKYQLLYPRIIHAILQTENQYSKGNSPGAILIAKCRGEYVAVCEGDDCWIEPQKLRKQVLALEKHKHINMSIHAAIALDVESGRTSIIGRYRHTDGVVPIQDIIAKRFGHIPTASTLVRNKVHSNLMAFRKENPYLTVGDIYLHFFGAEPYGAWYVDSVDSVYRMHVPNSWSQRYRNSIDNQLKHTRARIMSYNELDRNTVHRYKNLFETENQSQVLNLLLSHRLSIREKLKLYREFSCHLKGRTKQFTLIYCILPPISVYFLRKVYTFMRSM